MVSGRRAGAKEPVAKREGMWRSIRVGAYAETRRHGSHAVKIVPAPCAVHIISADTAPAMPTETSEILPPKR